MIDLAKRFVLSSGTFGRSMMAGAFWTTGSFAYRYALRLLSTVIVTRLLDPEAYGLMSLAMIFITGLSLLCDVGIAPSVIRSARGDTPEFLRTAWTLNILRGMLIGLLGCALAWPASAIYEEPQLFALICALSLMPVLDGLLSVSQLVCTRRVQLFRLSMIEIASATFATSLTIFFAWQLQSVWALVIGTLGGVMVKLIGSYVFLPPFVHRLYLNRADAREILTFGGWILLATIVTFVGGRGLILIQGTLVPIEVLGFIALADTLAWAMGELISLVLSKVFFPAISEVSRNRPHELKDRIQRVQKIVYVGLIPLFVLLSFLAHPLIDLIYDDRYAMVATFLTVMAINCGLGIISLPYGSVIMAKGDGRTHLKFMTISALSRLVLSLVGFYVLGPVGMIAGIGVALVFYNAYVFATAATMEFGNFRRDICMLAVLATVQIAVSFKVIFT